MNRQLMTSGIVGAAVAAVLSWLLATRQPVLPARDGKFPLRYGAAWRVLTWVLLVLPPVGLLALALLAPAPPEQMWLPFVMAGGFLGLTAPIAIEVFGVSHQVSDTGIERGSPWARRPVSILWQDVRTVQWSASMQWFVVESVHGDRIRISHYLSGLQPFRERVLSRAPATAFDTSTRAELERWLS